MSDSVAWKHRCIIVLMAMLLPGLAGCLGEAEEPGTTPEPRPDSPDPAGEPKPPAPTEPTPRDNQTVENGLTARLQLDGCSWILASHHHPGNTNPTPVPPGWDSETGRPFTTNNLRALQCSSIALDELDRPATILFETSNAGTPPSDCWPEEEARLLFFVVNLLVDDPDLARLLQERYGAPAEVATIGVQSDGTTTTWTWSAGGAESTLAYPQNVEEDQVPHSPRRWMWPTETGIMALDADFTSFGPDHASRAATGQLAPSHYLGVGGQFAGPAEAGPEASMSARFQPLGPACAPLA